MKRKWFFGWSNIKWFISEIGKIYSSKPSFFSKKRIESGIAFFIGQWGMIYYAIVNFEEMTSADITLWAGIEFAIAGYMVTQIQKEKKIEKEEYPIEEPINESEINKQ